MPLDNKTLETDLYNSFFGVPPGSVEVSVKTQKDKILDNKAKKELEVQVKYMVLAIEKYIKTATVETNVKVEILESSISSLGSPGSTLGPPVALEVTGKGDGKIK